MWYNEPNQMKLRSVKINLFVFIGLLVLGFSFLSFAEEKSQTGNNIFLDSDQDGLSNDEEKTYGTDPNNADTDGDGYSDGVEVKGGYNPLKPAPGDKISITEETTLNNTAVQAMTNKGNLTQNVSDQMASLISEKSISNEAIGIEDIDAIINRATTEGETSILDNLPEIDMDTVKIKKQDYNKLTEKERLAKEKEDSTAYLTSVIYILLNNAPKKISSEKDISDLSQDFNSNITSLSSNMLDLNYFTGLAEKGDSVIKQLEAIEVPEQMVERHVKGIQLFQYAKKLKDELGSTANDDPLATIVVLSRAKEFISLSSEFFDTTMQDLTSLGFNDLPINI